MPFQCSICGEESTRICARCTKDACDNHLCDKCRKCSDCCECEVALSPHAPETVREAIHPETVHTETVVEAVGMPETVPEAPPKAPAESPTPTEASAEASAIEAIEREPEPPAEPESEVTPTEAAPELPPAVPETPVDPAAEAPGSNVLAEGHESAR